MNYISLKERLIHYYEVDIDNCNMTQEAWVEELAKAILDPNYLDKFNNEYEDYLNTIEYEDTNS